jgi:hypothetical protein
MAKGWTTEESEFELRQGQEFSFLLIIQTGSGVCPTSYPKGTRGSLLVDKATGA